MKRDEQVARDQVRHNLELNLPKQMDHVDRQRIENARADEQRRMQEERKRNGGW